MRCHPLLRSVVRGSSGPNELIDLSNMVRRGDPDPLTFCEMPAGTFGNEDVLSVIETEGEDDEEEDDLSESSGRVFRRALDEDVTSTGNGPLWRVELHTTAAGTGGDGSSALILVFKHAISDQSSANLMLDHILSALVSIEEGTSPSPSSPSSRAKV